MIYVRNNCPVEVTKLIQVEYDVLLIIIYFKYWIKNIMRLTTTTKQFICFDFDFFSFIYRSLNAKFI